MIKKTFERIKQLDTKLIIFIVFIVSTLVLFAMFGFEKRISIISDEIIYYDFARSLFYGTGTKQLAAPREFQKILYSLLICPFFAIKNSELRIYMISLFNCLLFASSCFPLWLIAKRYLTKNESLFVLAINIVFPYSLFAGTFMSEILYYPLVLWGFYLFIKTSESNNLLYSILFGLVCYLIYFCKEVGLAFLLSFFLIKLLFPIIDKVLDKNVKIVYSKMGFISLVITVLVFGGCFFGIKYGLFNGDVSYGPSKLLAFSFRNIFLIAYGFVYSVAVFSFSVLVLPILLTILNLKNYNKKFRETVLLMLLVLLVLSAVISYKITVREEWLNLSLADFWKARARGMMRYYGPLFVLFMIPFIFVINSKEFNLEHSKKNIIIYCVFAAIISFVFKGTTGGIYMDAFPIMWYTAFSNGLNELLNEAFPFVIMLINLIICFVLFAFVFFVKDNKQTRCRFFIFFGVTSLASYIVGVGSIRTNIYKSFHYDVDHTEVVNIAKIDNYMCDKKNKNVLVLFSDNILTFDTYINYNDNYRFNRMSTFEDNISKKRETHINVSEIKFIGPYDGLVYPTVDHIDYLIFEKNKMPETFKILNLDIISECSGEYWSMYVNKTPSYFEINK